MRPWGRLRGKVGTDAGSVVKDRLPTRIDGDRDARYMPAPEAGSRRAAQFGMLPGPERATVMRQVEQIIMALDGAIDEGTGHVLDPLIKSWTGHWIVTAEIDYDDYRAEIHKLRGQARQWLAMAARTARDENEELDRIRGAYLACQLRLTGEQADQAIPGVTAQAVLAGPEDPGPRWSAPHPVAGRSRTGLIVTALIALAGAFTVTMAFRHTLALALPQQPGALAWLISAGATSMALAAAASMGVYLAVRRRSAHRGSGLAAALTAVSWIGLGLAAVLVPLLGAGAYHTPQAALFSGAVYLSSGAWAIFEAERLYNPEYSAYARLGRRYRLQQRKAADAEATANRAAAAVDHLDFELDHAEQLRQVAIADRNALGAEAANYARVLMAAMLKDPAKTGLIETGPDSPSANALSERTEIP